MSEAATAPVEAPAAAPAATDLTGVSTPPATPADGQPLSPASGEGEGAAVPGQGAAGEALKEGAPANSETAPAAEGGEAQGAPEQYAAFNVQDGYSLEGDWLGKVTDFAKAQNMTQAQAQGLVDLGMQQAQRLLSEFASGATQTPVVARDHWAKSWSEQTTADAEIGGDNLTGSMATATKVFKAFATPELAEFLGQTGLAHHPELIRFMTKIGKAVSEDVLVVATGGQGQPSKRGENTAKKLYPNMN